MKTSTTLIGAVILLAMRGGVHAEQTLSPTTVTIVRAATPPAIDGVLGDDEWRNVAPIPLAYQTQPGENADASERTEARFAYDREHLYIAIRAWDSDPSAVRGRVTRRDEIFGDDYVTLHLDTYDDRRRAYVFSFNPLGIQGDGLFTEGQSVGNITRSFDRNIDRTWDAVLTSRGRIVDDGFIVEAAIPFKSLRYQAGPGRRWGLHVQRWIARKGENVSWRPLGRDAPSLLTQMGVLAGLDEISGGPALDLIPTLTSVATGTRQADGTLADTGDVDPGVTANWAVTPNMTVSATANPDFSQIEADVPQIDVNQRFPLRYPERRPFFLEGGQYFRSVGQLNFVETRRIVDPDWGTKLTGKVGRNTYALLAGGDAAAGRAVEPGAPGSGDAAGFVIGRYQRDVLQNSTVGAFVTNRRFAGSDNTVLAVDGQFRLQRQTVGYQLGTSFTDLAATETTTPRSQSSRGDASFLWYDLDGRHWRLLVSDYRISSDYRAETAFVRRAGFQENLMILGYEFQGDRTWWVRARPFYVARVLRTPERRLDESYIDPGVDLTLARDIKVMAYRSFHRDAFQGREYDYQYNRVDYTINTFKRITFDGRFQFGDGVHFDPARPQVARHLNSSLTVAFKPNAQLNSELIYLKSRLTEQGSGRELVDQDIVRNRTNYQFTREHAARSIIEYNTFSQRLSVSLLYTYLPQPNTAIFAGYGDLLLHEMDPLSGARMDGFQRIQRSFFVKLSHNFRL